MYLIKVLEKEEETTILAIVDMKVCVWCVVCGSGGRGCQGLGVRGKRTKP